MAQLPIDLYQMREMILKIEAQVETVLEMFKALIEEALG